MDEQSVAKLVPLAQLVFDPDKRGAHFEVDYDDTTEDLVWSLDFWRGSLRPEIMDLLQAVLWLHCL